MVSWLCPSLETLKWLTFSSQTVVNWHHLVTLPCTWNIKMTHLSLHKLWLIDTVSWLLPFTWNIKMAHLSLHKLWLIDTVSVVTLPCTWNIKMAHLSLHKLWLMDTVSWLCPALETLKWLTTLLILMKKPFRWWQCSVSRPRPIIYRLSLPSQHLRGISVPCLYRKSGTRR